MTDRQRRFCDEYLLDCNATQAAIRSGYSPRSADRMLKLPDVQEYLEEQMALLHSEKIADVREITEYLTSVMRGQHEGRDKASDGERTDTARTDISTKERLKAAELLGKRYGLFKEKNEVSLNAPVIISGEEELDG